MLSLLDAVLVLVVFPLAAALVNKSGAGTKTGWAILTLVIGFLIDSVFSTFQGEIFGVFATIITGVIMCMLSMFSGGRNCPECQKRISPKASICPYCRSAQKRAVA